MTQLEHIEAIEKSLWSAADTLRANSAYASNEYFLPVMGLIFLRYAYSRYLTVKDEIEANLPKRGGKTRPLTKEDFSRKSAIFLRPEAQFDYLVSLPDNEDRIQAIIRAMESIEQDYENLRGVLPKAEYQDLDNQVLGQLLRTLNPEELRKVSGDVFGRIYEYFLTQFADQKAHDGGEFFTPISLVSLIANVLEPERGIVLDPACGSGGMFVQSARVVEHNQQNPMEKLTFKGLEKNGTTIRLAKMNLAVHGLEGNIQQAITYYEDPHELLGKADYVMANPPFNVDEIDADKIKSDPRLPFGLPGVNKKGKVSNGNYIWISYFYSYLNEKGRAGFVMSSQASSAGRDEAKVRRKLIETGAVDIMIAIRSNFFYTRTVPCELWFLDRAKPERPSSQALLPGGEGEEESSTLKGGEGQKKSHYRGGYYFSGLVERARELRKEQTPAEELFWQLVRNRQFLGLKFRRQHQFGNYILDFYCHEQQLAIELDGPIHETQKEEDARRDAYLQSQGLTVIRIKNEELLNAIEDTLHHIASTIKSPLPLGEDLSEGAPLNHKGHVLMIDARNIYRKVTRKIYDFSPEQQQNILAIVWLYRGQQQRFLRLIESYLNRTITEAGACFQATDEDNRPVQPLPGFVDALDELLKNLEAAIKKGENNETAEIKAELDKELAHFLKEVKEFRAAIEASPLSFELHPSKFAAVVAELKPLAENSRDLIKQIDLLFKLAGRLALTPGPSPGGREEAGPAGRGENNYSGKSNLRSELKHLDEARRLAVEQLKQVRYYWKQAHWLAERFPEAKLRDVPGLVKRVTVEEIAANDWSLTPGRYVGVAPEEEDEDFDFEEALREIHVELEDLNVEAAKLAEIIKKNFEELGI
ncbi:MAG: hypothetical protein Kow0037_20580 [Calditrichia bacterium]